MSIQSEKKSKNLYEFFKILAIGFSIASALVAIGIMGYIFFLKK